MLKLKRLLKSNNFYWALVIFSVGFPFIQALKSILEGSIPFWFDPARDFLLAQDNLHKISLIGPPTGIPNVFYGPYWIWFISFAMLFSGDPRFIAFFTLTLPYFILFPLILFKFKNIFGRFIPSFLWLLFIISYYPYSTSLWNPNLAPLLYLLLIYLLVSNKIGKKRMLFAGFICGLLMNIHLSFGIGIAIASSLYLTIEVVINTLKNRKIWIQKMIEYISYTVIYLLAIFIAFLPFILFETRHGYHQIISLENTVINSFFYKTAAVGQVGFQKSEILFQFISVVPNILKIPLSLLKNLIELAFVYLIYKIIRSDFTIKKEERKLTILLLLSFISLFYLYHSTENPVYSYHFIAVEIIALLLIGIFVKKLPLFKYALIIWVVFLFSKNIISVLNAPHVDPLSISSYSTKKYIVDLVYKDSGAKPFIVYVYSPSIYTYDYDYIFNFEGEKNHYLLPKTASSNTEIVYLIIPPSKDEIIRDFINYKTPDKSFKTIRDWNIADGTKIIKRAKI